MDLTLISDPTAFDAAFAILTWCAAIASIPVGIGVAMQAWLPN